MIRRFTRLEALLAKQRAMQSKELFKLFANSDSDECFIVMSRDTYHNVCGFDQKIFDGWLFYVVALTLRAEQKHILVVIVRANAWHRSYGTIDKSFDKYKNILRKKYKNDYFKIYYPCGWTYTNDVFFYVRDFLHNIRMRLKGER